MKVTNPPFTVTIAVSLHLVYYSFSHVRLCFSFSFLWKAKLELVWSVGSGVQVLKKYGGRQKMNLVFEGFFTVKFFIRSIPLDC